MNATPLLEIAGLAVAGGGVATASYRELARPTSFSRRNLGAYQDWLERRLKSLFLPPRAVAIMVAQAAAAYAFGAGSIAVSEPKLLVLVPIVLLLPWAAIEVAHRRRVHRIEAQTDGFMIALANALKATPSVAESFASLATVVAQPLRSEIALAVKHMHLGCTFEEALVMMGGRIGSRTFDTALASILIGQRIGGNLPKTLESAGAAIRELSRLDGMVRARTANGRIQMFVISAAPIVFVVGFGASDPHFFDPLTTSSTGQIMLAAAVLSWAAAIVLGRRFLRVDF